MVICSFTPYLCIISCTLRMSHCLWDFSPVWMCCFFLFFPCYRWTKKIALHQSMRRSLYYFLLSLVTRDLFSLSDCLVMHNHPIHKNPIAYFIYQSGIHSFCFHTFTFCLCLSFSFGAQHWWRPNHSTNWKFMQRITSTAQKKEDKQINWKW